MTHWNRPSAAASIPTDPIGSIPRPVDLIERVAQGDSEDPDLAPHYEEAIRDTIDRFEATGSPVVTDGEQRKYNSSATYSVHGLPNTAPDGFAIAFSDGHTRRLARLTRGPFRYMRYVWDRVLEASEYLPIEQLGTTDDWGFSPFFDNTSTSRDTAFAKIRPRAWDGTRGEASGSPAMTTEDDDAPLLRSVALTIEARE